MKCSIMQSRFMPWAGYCYLMARVNYQQNLRASHLSILDIIANIGLEKAQAYVAQ